MSCTITYSSKIFTFALAASFFFFQLASSVHLLCCKMCIFPLLLTSGYKGKHVAVYSSRKAKPLPLPLYYYNTSKKQDCRLIALEVVLQVQIFDKAVFELTTLK